MTVTVPACPGWLFEDDYLPPPALRVIARRHPEIEWLCFSPPGERRWHYTDPYRLDWIVTRFPNVTAEEWVALFS